jgi:prevent-host-death family protein
MKISLKDDINSLSYFKTNFNKILKKIQNSHHPLIITQNGKSSGVFLDIETWESIIKKINLLKFINEGELSLNKEKTKSLEEVEEYFNKKYDL